MKLLEPTPPTVPPAALVVPSMNPWATYCSVVMGFTPEENLATMIGMFEIMGRFSIIFSSKFWPDETVFVSRSGVARRDIDALGDRTDLQFQGQAHRLADRQDDRLVHRLEARHFHRHLVVARVEERRFEIPAAVGGEPLGLFGVDVRNRDGRPGDHSGRVLDGA